MAHATEPTPSVATRYRQLQEKGFVYENAIITPEEARAACAEIDKAFEGGGRNYSRIQSAREQYKLGRDLEQLTEGVRVAVEKVQERLQHLCKPGEEVPPLMDVYALRTGKEEEDPEARAPQRWHLDDYTKFPVAALVLRGRGATEFHTGAYADFTTQLGDENDDMEERLREW